MTVSCCLLPCRRLLVYNEYKQKMGLCMRNHVFGFLDVHLTRPIEWLGLRTVSTLTGGTYASRYVNSLKKITL